MTSSEFVSILAWLVLGVLAQTVNLTWSSSVRHEIRETGESLTLPCVFKQESFPWLYWFKESLGEKPRPISSIGKYGTDQSFYGEFKDDSRFKLDAQNNKNDLNISDLQVSDSAIYHCISSDISVLEVLDTIIVSVKGSGVSVPALVHQSESETIQPGGSVTLNCTVHTGSCDGEHSVYWFRNSEEAHPGLIYTHGGRNDQCERNPHSHTHTCVYNLAMRGLNLSHAGTYYCAVVSCGHILFGDGTKLEIKDEGKLMSGALAGTTILVVLLTFALCVMKKRSSSRHNELEPGAAVPPSMTAEGYQTKLNLYYAALGANLTDRSRPQRDQTWSECVYYCVKK